MTPSDARHPEVLAQRKPKRPETKCACGAIVTVLVSTGEAIAHYRGGKNPGRGESGDFCQERAVYGALVAEWKALGGV